MEWGIIIISNVSHLLKVSQDLSFIFILGISFQNIPYLLPTTRSPTPAEIAIPSSFEGAYLTRIFD